MTRARIDYYCRLSVWNQAISDSQSWQAGKGLGFHATILAAGYNPPSLVKEDRQIRGVERRLVLQ